MQYFRRFAGSRQRTSRNWSRAPQLATDAAVGMLFPNHDHDNLHFVSITELPIVKLVGGSKQKRAVRALW